MSYSTNIKLKIHLPESAQTDNDGAPRTIDISQEIAQQAHLASILRQHELHLNTRCGHQGICQGCELTLHRGKLRDMTGQEVHVDADDEPRVIRSCQYHLIPADQANAPCEISIPQRSLAELDPIVVSDFKLEIPHGNNPICDPVKTRYALAVDIGTTTVAVLCLDLKQRQVVRRVGQFNAQTRYADNVLSRINLCMTNPQLLGELQDAVIRGTMGPMIETMLSEAEIPPEQVGAVVMAGNTTMLHLLLGEDPSSMGVAPFTPSFTEPRTTSADKLKLDPLKPDCPIQLLPSASAYIGADITAGVVASGMITGPKPALLVDIGTNGEIVLVDDDKMTGCSTAAGPAFEGSGLAWGSRAVVNAISHVHIDPKSHEMRIERLTEKIQTRGKRAVPGICGTAYIDFLAEAYRAQWIGPSGRFNTGIEAEVFTSKHHGNAISLAKGGQKLDPEQQPYIAEGDLATLLQAKAAIAAGITILLSNSGYQAADIGQLYLAGGFGMAMNVSNAITMGLLPGFNETQIKLVGNTALAGAALCCLDVGFRDEIDRIARNIEVVELNTDPMFETTFIDQMMLP